MQTTYTTAVREDGDSNFYHLDKGQRWLAVVQLNGEFTRMQQLAIMNKMAEAMDAYLDKPTNGS